LLVVVYMHRAKGNRAFKFPHVLGLSTFAVTAVGMAETAAANNFQVLYNFQGGTGGYGAFGSLIASGGYLYGMTRSGGASHLGTIFSFNTATNSETILHSFGGYPDGSDPWWGSLIASGSYLYGMTRLGGANQNNDTGTIFSYNTITDMENILHSFNSQPAENIDGYAPFGSLIQSGSTLYGMTSKGGTGGVFGQDQGTIFSYNTSNNTETVLHAFGATGDGAYPEGSLIASGSYLYGMTNEGGTNHFGALISFNTSTDKEKVLHSFSESNDGFYPTGSLIASGSYLYGMTQNGGAYNGGTIFSYNISTGTERVLRSFGSDTFDGVGPRGSLIASGGYLYGMTFAGGSYSKSSGDEIIEGPGTIFSYNITTGVETILHSFAGGKGDGGYPRGDLLLDGSTLYGMTDGGGANNAGVIFSYTLPEPGSLALLALGGLPLFFKQKNKLI